MKSIYKIRLSIAIIIFILSILGLLGLFYPIKIFDIQFMPLFQRVISDFSILAISLLLGLILLTLLFGRLYCSLLCPFGIMQEIICLIFKRKNKPQKSYPIKYFIFVVTFGALIGGSALLIRYIEPYSYFGSLITLNKVGIIASILVIILTLYKARFFCINICPIGAILGLISKISLCKISIDKSLCINCSKCVSICPSRCVDFKEGKINNETCIKCLKCIESCPKNAINYSIEKDLLKNFASKTISNIKL